MCNERERLIGYVYDECDPGERALVQQHLESCDECRTEIAALRSVRADLQTWEVPDHESVWRPFAPAPASAWWSQVPRWAMAAAAGLVVISGAAGGALAHAMMPHESTIVASNNVPVSNQASLTNADLDALERRMNARLQAEVTNLAGRVITTSSASVPRSVAMDPDFQAMFERQLADLRVKTDAQTDAIALINNNFEQYKKSFNISHAAMGQRVAQLTSLLESR